MYKIGGILLLQALFASTGIINKKLILYAHPLCITTLELLVVGVLIIIFIRQIQSEKQHNLFIQTILFGQLAVIAVTRHALKYWGLLYLPATKISILLTATPCFIALFSQLAFKKKLSKKQWIALVITCFGMLPVLIAHKSFHELGIDFFSFTFPDLAVFTAMILYSISAVAMQKLIKEYNYHSSIIYGLTSFYGGIFGISILSFMPEYRYIHDINNFFIWFLLLIIINKLVCSLAYYRLFHYYSATFIALSDCITPLFVGLYSCFLLQEVPTWHYAASFIIMTSGIFLFYQNEL